MKKIILINIILIIIYIILPEKEVIKYEEIKTELETNIEIPLKQTRIENKPLSISNKGIILIKQFEGLKLNSYRLQGETNYTIGYGHSGNDVEAGQTITEKEAEELLLNDLQKTTNYVLAHCEYLNLTQNELDALISFTYNGGNGMLNQLTNNGTRTKEEIANHITAYTSSSNEANREGLLRRRLAEKELFLGGN